MSARNVKASAKSPRPFLSFLRSLMPVRHGTLNAFRRRIREELRETWEAQNNIAREIKELNKRFDRIEKRQTDLRLKVQSTGYDLWREQNPSAPFSDYYAKGKLKSLTTGAAHGTIGGNLTTEAFGESGKAFFETLRKHGLKRGDVCVDYGCGTLRIGVHVIDFLEPGAYWGMDIADFMLDAGRKLIGENAVARKAPNLRVISPATVAEVARAKPRFLFSHKVMQHVHPDELHTYFANILDIVGASGKALISSHWSEGATEQYAIAGWDHSEASIAEAIAKAGGRMIMLTNEAPKPSGRICGEFFVSSAALAPGIDIPASDRLNDSTRSKIETTTPLRPELFAFLRNAADSRRKAS